MIILRIQLPFHAHVVLPQYGVLIGSRFYVPIFVVLLSRINIVVNLDKNPVDRRRGTAFNT